MNGNCNTEENVLVRVVETLGTDESITVKAGICFDSDNSGEEKTDKVIKHLIERDHLSPFEFGRINFEVHCPIFVSRQIMRHRTGNYIEKSLRYTGNPVQSSLPILTSGLDDVHSKTAIEMFDYVAKSSIDIYNGLIRLGVKKEEARRILPLNTQTAFYMGIDLRNLMNLFEQRLALSAQVETRDVVKQMAKWAEFFFPVTMKYWSLKNEKCVYRD